MLKGFIRASTLVGILLSPAVPALAGRPWSLKDEISVPKVSDLRLLRDASAGAYIVHKANLATNRVEAELRQFDLKSRNEHRLIQAEALEKLRQIPGSPDWSILADFGKGQQLFRVTQAGSVTPIIENPETVLTGDSDGAIASLAMEAPRSIGVISYNWSPDGRWLWYAIPKLLNPSDSPISDDDVEFLQLRRRRVHRGIVEFHLRDSSGDDRVVAQRPDSDRLARYLGGNVRWQADELQFSTEDHSDLGDEVTNWAQPLSDHPLRKLGRSGSDPFRSLARGPHGGLLAVSGDGEARHLWETEADGAVHDFGYVDYVIGGERSADAFLFSEGKLAVIGVQSLIDGSHRLVRIDPSGAHPIPSQASLTHCDFVDALTQGLCVEEGISVPSRLVIVKPNSGEISALASLAPDHDEITPLRVTMENWVSHSGIPTNGYIVWPRHYRVGRRYPAILVTHGFDGDDSFVNLDLQWNYPVQFFAEHDYLVVVMNDPSPRLIPALRPAFNQWGSGQGALSPKQMRELLWLSGVECFEDAIKSLESKGVIDGARVGIAGYSRGSQMVDVTMTRSTMFRAASSGDGGYLEPVSFDINKSSYSAVFGGSPFGPSIVNYQALSPSLNAEHGKGAVLQQVAGVSATTLDFHRAIRSAGRAAQITLYPGENVASDETHVFHIPRNQLLAMQENVTWFDFWLKGERSVEVPWPERYEAWSPGAKRASAGQ